MSNKLGLWAVLILYHLSDGKCFTFLYLNLVRRKAKILVNLTSGGSFCSRNGKLGFWVVCLILNHLNDGKDLKSPSPYLGRISVCFIQRTIS